MLNGLVWRKIYLSLFAFTRTFSIETLPDESRLLRLDGGLRPLPPSEFPHPFWHSAAKWRSYQQTRQIGLYFRGGKLLAAYRPQLNPNLPVTEHRWGGLWRTDEAASGPPAPFAVGTGILQNGDRALGFEARHP
jgi:hypothetical protein